METNQQRFVKEYTEKKTGRWQRFSGKGRLADVRIDAIQNFLQYKRNTEKFSKKSNLFYIDMLALLAKPCIVMAQKVIKVGKAIKPKGYC